MSKLKILLVEDHHLVRAGLRALIDAQDDMAVIAEAGDGQVACQLVDELVPDVVVMDVSMPVMGGAQATAQIKRDRPRLPVLALTIHEDRGYLQQLIQAGASGYLLKRAAADELIFAIHAVARGGTYLDPGLNQKVLGGLMRRLPKASGALSDREEEVLRQIARGFTNREVAQQLDVSVKTIETHKARAMEKLGMESRAQIVAYAIEEGWLGTV